MEHTEKLDAAAVKRRGGNTMKLLLFILLFVVYVLSLLTIAFGIWLTGVVLAVRNMDNKQLKT